MCRFSPEHLARVVLLSATLLSTNIARAEAFDLSGDLNVGSDYAFRGVSQTMSAPAIDGTLLIEHQSGWYGYVWASNVDFIDDRDPDDGARLEVDLEVGYYYSLSERIAVSLAWTNYLFPGTESGVDYDYAEFNGNVYLDDRHYIAIGHSEDAFATDQSRTFYAIGTAFDVFSDLSISLELGRYDLDRSYSSGAYEYAEIAMNGDLQSLNWRVAYVTTNREAKAMYYESTVKDRLVFTLGVSF